MRFFYEFKFRKVQFLSFFEDLKLAGLDYLNISLDTLQEKKYGFVTRRPSNGFHRVMQAIDKSIDLGTYWKFKECYSLKIF